jgi:Zn ribbon nucleic-acid-binding protein
VKIARTLVVFAFVCSTLANAGAVGTEQDAPKQPIPFNHKLHAGTLKQSCTSCHADTNPGELVDMPEVSKCMACHSNISPKTPGEQKLAAFAKQNRDLDWVRVYQIPTFVKFSHRQHEQAGAKCETCHGAVAQRVTLWQEKEMSMGTCMTCHRETNASLDCGSCHQPR